MSYNTRRGTPVQQNVGTIGSRRPQVSNNFVPGGQLTPQKGGTGTQQPQQQGYSSTQQPANRQQQPQPQRTQQQLPQKPQPVVEPPQPAVVPPVEIPDENMENGSDIKVEGEKKKWTHRKIPKKEKLRRRNLRLSKLLQPKNALMILNELVKNVQFNVCDHNALDVQYKATALVEGIEHVGYGRSKNGAKNAAAETALQYLIKHKKLTQMSSSVSEDGAEQMDTSEGEDDPDGPLPWQQVASFALFKLFTSWGENPNIKRSNPATGKTSDGSEEPTARELKPAKKLPDNAIALNPMMLVHQMHPNAKYEELQQTGVAPNAIYNMQCIIDGEVYKGSGPTKKLAKKYAAFAACSSIHGLQYPPEVYVPQVN